MDSSHDIEALSRWTASGAAHAELCTCLAAHPQFTAAARALYRGKVATAAADPVMAGLFRDAGHYVVALLAFSLHREVPGITLPRLKQACADSGLLSPGRVRALLGYLQHGGYVSSVTTRFARQAARYVPTPKFIEAWCQHMRAGLEAAALVEPSARALIDRLDEPGALLAFSRYQGDVILRGLNELKNSPLHDLPAVRIFNHRLGGGRVLALMLSRDEGQSFLNQPVACQVDDLVRRCGISRVQVKRLLSDAGHEGLFRVEGDELTWNDSARTFIMMFTAFEFGSLLASAAATIEILSKSHSEAPNA